MEPRENTRKWQKKARGGLAAGKWESTSEEGEESQAAPRAPVPEIPH